MNQQNRLKKRKQFNYLFKHGKHVSNEVLSLVFLSVKTKNYKLGYSVSKKVGKAVVRNKVKRRLKECVHKFSKSIKNEFYIVVVPKPNIVNLSFQELFNKTVELFNKAKLLNE